MKSVATPHCLKVINLGGDANLASSWMLTLGLTSIALSLVYRQPILIAWSTPGAALLITSAQGFTLNQAVAGFLFSAMLGGILINFGIDVFNQMNQQPLLVAAMFISYILAKQLLPKFTMLIVLIVGITLAWPLQLVNHSEIVWQQSEFSYIAPDFSLAAMMGIGLALFTVTMAAQNLADFAVLKAHHYQPPVSSILSVTGIVNLLSAPFGGYAINLAAITAAICMTKGVDKDPDKRHWAAVSGGLFYIIMALCAEFLMSLFSALPSALIYALAGIALFTTITNSVSQALAQQKVSEAAMVTFLITASDLSLWGISSALWGLIAGSTIIFLQQLLGNYHKRS